MLKHTIASDLKDAMKSRDETKRSTLRMLISAIHNKEIEKGKKEEGLSDEELLQVVRSEVKRRKEAALEFERGGRKELAEKEKAEAVVLEVYLPAELSDEELRALVATAVKETNAVSQKDFGAVMKQVMANVGGRASGDRVSALVREELQNAAV